MQPEHRKVEALLAMGRSEEAARLAGSLPAMEKPTVEFLRLRGRAMRAAGRHFDAESSFREALALSPTDPGIMADLATTLVGQSRLKEAHAYAREAVGGRPDVAAWQALLGYVADRLDLVDEARRALQLARELAPSDAEAHTVYGFHALRSGDLPGAEEAFRAALAADPRRSEGLHGLAKIALRRADLETARRHWHEALALDPRRTDRRLERAAPFGHPLLRPIRAATRLPAWASAALATSGGAVIYLSSGLLAAQAAAVALLAVAAAGPLARRVILGGLGE